MRTYFIIFLCLRLPELLSPVGEFVAKLCNKVSIPCGPCISFFGSARTKADNKYYKLAEEIASEIVGRGYGVITCLLYTSDAADE